MTNVTKPISAWIGESLEGTCKAIECMSVPKKLSCS